MVGDGDSEVTAESMITEPAAMATGVEPPQQIHEVLSMMKENQDKMLNEVRVNQQNLQDKLENAICNGLEGITEIRYGTQAKEYHQETMREITSESRSRCRSKQCYKRDRREYYTVVRLTTTATTERKYGVYETDTGATPQQHNFKQ